MNRLLPNFLAPLAAGAVGAAIVLLSVQPQATAPQPVDGPSLAVAPGSDGSDALAARLTDLEMELAGLADRVEQLAAVRASVPAPAEGAAQSAPSDPAAADALLQVGESPRAEDLPAVEHAAWTVVSGTVLNLSEAVTRG